MDLKVKYKKHWGKPKLTIINIVNTQGGGNGVEDGAFGLS
jgi:hypothetical protein